MPNLNPTHTPKDLAMRSAQQLWAIMELLQRLAIPAEDLRPELGVAAKADGTGFDAQQKYLALRITTQGLPPFSVNVGPLLVTPDVFQATWPEWIRTVRGAFSETVVEKQNREQVMLEMFKASDAWNERVSLQDYLTTMGVKFTRLDDAAFGA